MTAKYPGAFVPTTWPLDRFVLKEGTRQRLFRFPDAIRKTRFPIASLRYWWLGIALAAEREIRAGELWVLDAGCRDGILGGYVNPMAGTRWLGIDHNLDWPQGDLEKYEALIRCNFESELPLRDSSVDVVVCSHVLEHLFQPQRLVDELARVLKEEGIFLVSVPILPKPLAHVAEWKYEREFTKGTRHKGNHVHAFWPSRLIRMIQDASLELEIASGTYFLRIDGFPLENLTSWIRANQYWAGLFPSLGGEMCAQFRKKGASS